MEGIVEKAAFVHDICNLSVDIDCRSLRCGGRGGRGGAHALMSFQRKFIYLTVTVT